MSNQTITQTTAERIVDAINEISFACKDDDVRVVYLDSDTAARVTVVISDPDLFKEVTSVGAALSMVH